MTSTRIEKFPEELRPTVIEALTAVMTDVQAVRKGDRNTQQNYSFRGIDAVVNAVGPALRTHSVIVAPVAVESHYRDVQTSQGKPSRECTVTVTYRFYGPAGDFIDVQVPGESMDFGDKGAPKAMSVAFRIALLQALCIPTDDPEPDAQSYERGTQDRLSAAAFMDDLTTRIDLASNLTELAGVEATAKRAFTDHKIDGNEARQLKELLDNRRAELTAPVGTP